MRPAIPVVLVLLFNVTTSSYYKYIGCFEKEVSGSSSVPRLFNNKYSGMPRLTLSVCLLECTSHNYYYVALDRTHCGCSNTVGHLRRESGCTAPCRTRPFPNVPCGGEMRLAVYQMTDKRHMKIYLGCYKLLPLDEDMAMAPLQDNSAFSGATRLVERFVATSCINHCAKAGYVYAALYNGDFCGCDTRLDTIKVMRHIHCNYPCEDVKLGTCGAGNDEPFVSVWKSDSAAVKLLPSVVDEDFNEKELMKQMDANIDDGDDRVQEFKITENGNLEWKNKEKKVRVVRYEREESSGDGAEDLGTEVDGPSGNGRNPLDDDGSGGSSNEAPAKTSTKASAQGSGKASEAEKEEKEDYYEQEEESEKDDVGSLGLPIGLGVGGGVVFLIVIVGICIVIKRKRSKVDDSSDEDDDDDDDDEEVAKRAKKKDKTKKDKTKKDEKSGRAASSRRSGSSREHKSSSRHRSSKERRSRKRGESSSPSSSRRHKSRDKDTSDQTPLLDKEADEEE
ncbi:protein PIF-like isoform X2 [Gigantopelta aegis]|uniref:protein PIF-like isoform X2 n=1 Tax=Gigantopelta aegis TaxID=1735272 RepID=UPI001B88B4B3|nr:protein PIF-like isoform X2 [Gigantopelta aegis]